MSGVVDEGWVKSLPLLCFATLCPEIRSSILHGAKGKAALPAALASCRAIALNDFQAGTEKPVPFAHGRVVLK